MGELSSHDFHDKAYGVRLRATICFEPSAQEIDAYPLEFQIAHYALSDPPTSVWGEPFRTVSDTANWIVSFGETFDRCGTWISEDVLPDTDYKGMESDLGILNIPERLRVKLGMSQCYGVSLTVKAVYESSPPVVRDAHGRAIVTCRSLLPT